MEIGRNLNFEIRKKSGSVSKIVRVYKSKAKVNTYVRSQFRYFLAYLNVSNQESK